MTNLNSVFAASVSMLNADLSLDIEGTIEHAFKVEKQGVSPAFLGSTSMSQFLSISEKQNDTNNNLNRDVYDKKIIKIVDFNKEKKSKEDTAQKKINNLNKNLKPGVIKD